MNRLFLKIITMSISAGWLVLAVLVLRLVLKKAPRRVHVLLWGMVAVRLVCPVFFESPWSLIPGGEMFSQETFLDAGSGDHAWTAPAGGQIRPDSGTGDSGGLFVSPGGGFQAMTAAAVIWIAGMVFLILFAVISYLRLRRRLDTAVLWKENLYQSEYAVSPFVLGVIRPRIYLPFKADEQTLEYAVAHERAHIRRGDHIWKPLGFFLLAVHWFNPLIWLSYVLLCRDIELACDEKVIREFGNEQKAGYARALLAFSMNRRMIPACPLAFGEMNVKERVKAVMHYRKPAVWIVLASAVVCAAAAVCFLTNPGQKRFSLRITVPAGSQEPFVYAEEEISPLGSRIIIASGEGLGDTEVILKAVQPGHETEHGPAYLTPGMPVKMDAEKGEWFRIGVNMQNHTGQDQTVYINVENVDVRVQGEKSSGLEQYRTDYIGDAVKVSKIAQLLPYPEDYRYSSVELQTRTEPYELIVYLTGQGDVRKEDFEQCAKTAFDLIGNMGMISFCEADSDETIASFSRTD